MLDAGARDDEDHDLLTFNESGARLRTEIEQAEADLLAASPGEEAVQIQARLRELRRALERNTGFASANPGEAGFLNYRPAPARQRRGRAIAMTPAEVDEFLGGERTCRVATCGADGRPHVAPLWFVWDGTSLWLNSLVRSQRWTDLARDPRVAVVVDAGVGFAELRGVELTGSVEPVGEIPRQAEPHRELAAELAEPELLFARKYTGGDTFHADGRHGWLRLTPEKLTSWDFRKMTR